MWCCDGAVSVELWWCCVCGAMMVLCLWVSSSRRFESSQFVRVRKQNVGICTPTTRKERRCDSPQASHLCFGKEHKLVFFLTFCWPCCISVYLSQCLTNLMRKICFTISFISCLYMFRAHVLIIRRSKLHYTASGIITPLGGCIMQFWPPDDEHMCSKHVVAWNKTYCETNFVHQVG